MLGCFACEGGRQVQLFTALFAVLSKQSTQSVSRCPSSFPSFCPCPSFSFPLAHSVRAPVVVILVVDFIYSRAPPAQKAAACLTLDSASRCLSVSSSLCLPFFPSPFISVCAASPRRVYLQNDFSIIYV